MKFFYTLLASALIFASANAQTASSETDAPQRQPLEASPVEPTCDLTLIPKEQQKSKVEFLKNSIVSFTTRDNKFHVEFGGRIDLRLAYDFGGLVNSIDFVPATIDMTGNESGKFRMDASTAVFHIKGHIDGGKLGPITFFVSHDFRGGAEGSYTPHLRSAYATIKGFLFGRHAKTFADLDSAPYTIDYQMPNAFTYIFSTQLRYEKEFAKKRLQMGVALELPEVTMTPNANFVATGQRMPDIPVYLEYRWGKRLPSHIRVSGLFRNLYYRNLLTESTTSQFGWAAQLSGHLRPSKRWDFFFNGIYGKGYSNYILDLIDLGMDLIPSQDDPNRLELHPMWSVQASGQFNITKDLFVSGGYSEVRVEPLGLQTAQYHRGQYIFSNIHYQLTPHFSLAGEYLYGTRENMNGEKHPANRLQMMVRYTF